MNLASRERKIDLTCNHPNILGTYQSQWSANCQLRASQLYVAKPCSKTASMYKTTIIII